MQVQVGSAATFAAAEAPKRLLDELESALSLPNPAHAAAVRRGRRPWGIEPRLRFVSKDGERVRIPRGAMSVLRQLAAAAHVELHVEDRRVLPPERLVCPASPSLRDYQVAAVTELERRHQGLFHLPAGSGKTRATLGAIAKLGTTALILVASLDLAEQWQTEIRAQLGVDAGLVGAGEEQVEQITVGVVQTLVRWAPERLDAFLARFGLLVIDEAHHTPSSTFASIVDRSPSKYRLALSATPTREDGLGRALEWFVGPTLATITHGELIQAGNLVAPTLRPLLTKFEFDYRGADDWAPLLDALWRDPGRNQLIVEAVAAEALAGHSVLVLTGRVEHARRLAEALTECGVSAAALVGEMSKRQRSETLTAAREGSLRALVATSLADEGLDLPRLSRVFLTWPAKAEGRTEQRIGRVMRPCEGKSGAVLVDVVDVNVGVLKHQARKRRAVFQRILGIEPPAKTHLPATQPEKA